MQNSTTTLSLNHEDLKNVQVDNIIFLVAMKTLVVLSTQEDS